MIFVDFPILFGTASSKVGFVQNRSVKSVKPVGLSDFGLVYRYDLNFLII
jgi:hypothetical protein